MFRFLLKLFGILFLCRKVRGRNEDRSRQR